MSGNDPLISWKVEGIEETKVRKPLEGEDASQNSKQETAEQKPEFDT